MNNLDKQYQNLLTTILEFGINKSDRTGTGTKSIFGYTIRHKMKEGFPLLTTKKMAFKTMVTELLWFLKGDTNIKYLLENNCYIWTGDAMKNYEKHNGEIDGGPYITKQEHFEDCILNKEGFAKVWGELGPIYGSQWRDWNGKKTDGFIEYESNGYSDHIKGIDQIQNLINELKTNPDSRRLMVNAWNVGELDNMVLPPCHYGFQVYTRELSEGERYVLLLKSGYEGKEMNTSNMMQICDDYNIPTRAISLMWNQRSVDTFLGLPFNIASYGLLLHLIANEVNMIPDELIGNLGDTHLYSNHIEQAKEQISRTSFEFDLPQLSYLDEYHYLNDKELVGDVPFSKKIEEFRPDFFIIKDYQSHPSIKAPLSN